MRLIDADNFSDRLIKQYCNDCEIRSGIKKGKKIMLYEVGEAPCRSCRIDDVFSEIDEELTINAVPVVRCKDCKYGKRVAKWLEVNKIVCDMLKTASPRENPPSVWLRQPEFYCAYGERKNES